MNKTLTALLLGLLAVAPACGGASAGGQAQEPAPATPVSPATDREDADASPWMDDAEPPAGGQDDESGPMNPPNQPPLPDPEPDDELGTGGLDPEDDDTGDDTGDDEWGDEDWEDGE